MTAMMAVTKFKAARDNHGNFVGQQHTGGSSGRRAAGNRFFPSQSPNNWLECMMLLSSLFRSDENSKCFPLENFQPDDLPAIQF